MSHLEGGRDEKIPCFACGREIDCEIRGDIAMVGNAVIWSTSGNYGSVVCDMEPQEIVFECVICDACMVDRRERLRAHKRRRQRDVLEQVDPLGEYGIPAALPEGSAWAMPGVCKQCGGSGVWESSYDGMKIPCGLCNRE